MSSHNWPEQVHKQYLSCLEERDKLQERIEQLERENNHLDQAQRSRIREHIGALERAVAAEAKVSDLGNQLAQERAKPRGTFDQWHRLQTLEAALKPFADWPAQFLTPEQIASVDEDIIVVIEIPAGDVQRARAALGEDTT